ncbi:hypothetical protein Tco_1553618 [Tanacetum coccineum]
MAKTGNEGKAKEMTDDRQTDGFIGVQNRKKVVQNQRWNWQKKSNHEERNKTQFVQKGMEEGASSSNGNQNGKSKGPAGNANDRNINQFNVLNMENYEESKELKMLRDRIVVDQFLNKKLQPSCSEVSKWSNDMVKYFKDQWEVDRLKEKEDQMQNMEDVFENDEGIAQTLTADTVKGKERKELWKDVIRAKNITDGWPWMMAGDFNVALKIEEHSVNPNNLFLNRRRKYAPFWLRKRAGIERLVEPCGGNRVGRRRQQQQQRGKDQKQRTVVTV